MRNAGETQESRRETLAYGQQICILAIGATARARAVLAIPNGSNQVEAAPLVAKGRVKSSPAAGPGSFPVTVHLHAGDQLLHPLIDRPERVLAQDGPLRLIVELEVHPVYREVAPPLLRAPDELAPQPGPRGLRRHRLRFENIEVAGDPGHRAAPLKQVIQASAAVHVVVGEIELGDSG